MDIKRIRRMVKVERLISRDAREELKIARYYRSDYLGMMLLKNFFLVTVGYMILIGLYLVGNGDSLLEGIYMSDLTVMITMGIGGYVLLLLLYSVLTYMICTLRHVKAKKLERYLDHQLELLQEEDPAETGSEHSGRGTV
ncbi:MAG TPA: hypothetical protein DF613_11725 [Lachnospiraceae bacterium]|nr:hypothetical protein [Lachnospiraceae bacterium]